MSVAEKKKKTLDTSDIPLATYLENAKGNRIEWA